MREQKSRLLKGRDSIFSSWPPRSSAMVPVVRALVNLASALSDHDDACVDAILPRLTEGSTRVGVEPVRS